MAKKITAGIQLELDDQLSPKIQSAGIAVENFAEKTVDESEKVDKNFTPKIRGAGVSAEKFADKADGAAGKVNTSFSSRLRGAGVSIKGFADSAISAAENINKAFSGIAGTLGTLGISIGALGAVKSTIDLDSRMARLGLTANLSAREVNELKRTIFDVAQMPDIKISPDPIIGGLEVILEKTGDIGQASKENIANLARAIQAAGTEGSAMGDVFSEFAKNKFSAQEITRLMDDIITISDMGEYTFVNFANTAKSVLSSYSLIGNTPKDVRNAVIAMQVLTAGTKSAEVAATALDSTMRELTDPTKRKALEYLGISVRNNATGEMRDFNDILVDVAAAYEDFRKADYINTVFGSETQKAIRAYNSEFARNISQMRDLGDTAGTLAGKSETMANVLASNFQNLQTAFLSFADKNLTGPLQDLTGLLNKLAEDPERVEAGIRSITRALLGLTAIKIGAGIISLVASLNSLKSGGGLNVSGLTNAGGGAGIPVHVTNWGGTISMPGGNGGLPGVQTGSGLVDQYGNPLSTAPAVSKPPLPNQTTGGWQKRLSTAKGSAAKAAGIQAVISTIGLAFELYGISKDETLSDDERKKRQGGATGDALGSITGATAGAFVGSLIAPGVGTIIGGMIGGWLGGTGGRWAGETLGAWKDRTQRELDAAQNNYQKVLEESADTLGKTEEEIENVRRKLAEAEARLEKAKEASEEKKAEEEKKKQAYEELAKIRMNEYNRPWSQTARTGGDAAVTYGGYVYRGYKKPAAPAGAGLPAANNRYQTFQGTPGIVQNTTNTANAYTVNDLIITPRGQFNTHPDDYILAMKNPAALINAALPGEIRNEVRTVERIPPAIPPVVIDGEIELRSELTIDDKGYRLRQSVGKNTTPYKFAVGSVKNARLIQ